MCRYIKLPKGNRPPSGYEAAFHTLLKEVACIEETDKNGQRLIEDDKVSEGKTKTHLVELCNDFLSKVNKKVAFPPITCKVSKKQLDHLAMPKKTIRISCQTNLILYVVYKLIYNAAKNKATVNTSEIKAYADLLFAYIKPIIRNNPGDLMLQYYSDTYDVLMKALSNKTLIPENEFPTIPTIINQDDGGNE